MKVIDLLNKIANGEEIPEKFKFAGQTFEKQGSYINDEDGDSIFASMFHDFSNINDEVEIIEENKPKTLNDIRESYGLPRIEDNKIEKLRWKECAINFGDVYKNIAEHRDKINEIIDKINED